MKTLATLAGAAALVTLPLAAQADNHEKMGETHTVTMTDDETFAPKTIEVSVGDTVVWENVSEVAHTVTADKRPAPIPSNVKTPEDARPFHSGFIETGDSFRYTFRVPGTYEYVCVPHDALGMRGTVVVSE